MGRRPNRAGFLGVDQMVEAAGCQGRVRRKAEAGEGSRESGLASGPPFSLCLRIWTCGPALAALEPGRCRRGPGRGLGADGVRGWGAPTSAAAGRVERAAAVQPGMAHAGFTWNTASLRQYLTDPQAKVKGNRMLRPGRPKDIDDVIAYIGTMK